MPEIEIIDEKPLTLAETKELLAKIIKDKEEPGFREKKTEEYLNIFAKEEKKKLDEVKKKLQDLNIQRLKERQIAKIVDIMPKDLDSMRVILSADNITLKQEDINKILECVK